jgi:hypothetical protein
MVYIVQVEEQEISRELLPQLAKLLIKPPDIIFADATHRIRSARGLLAFDEKAEAAIVSKQFNELGYRNFLLDELLPLPKRERLSLEQAELDPNIGLAAAAKFVSTSESTVEKANLNVGKLATFALTGFMLPGSGKQTETVKHSETTYLLELFTAEKRWQAPAAITPPLQHLLNKLPDAASVYYSLGAQNLRQGNTHLPTFESAKDYEHYLTWLFQLRYAAGE